MKDEAELEAIFLEEEEIVEEINTVAWEILKKKTPILIRPYAEKEAAPYIRWEYTVQILMSDLNGWEAKAPVPFAFTTSAYYPFTVVFDKDLPPELLKKYEAHRARKRAYHEEFMV